MSRLALVVVAGALCAWLPSSSFAQGHPTHEPFPESALVDFGVLPTGPLGPASGPCAQSGVGGPADPCSYKIHNLTPEEVTIQKGGQVTFQVHGGGHAFAIYEVSPDTTRDGIGQQICAGPDPRTVDHPDDLSCNLDLANANARHIVTDGRDDVVLDVQPNAGSHPTNRVWSEPGRLMSAGAHQFLNGGSVPAGATSNGQILTYRFLKTGRYLVLCMNRVHFFNDWMFGFVNVAGGGHQD